MSVRSRVRRAAEFARSVHPAIHRFTVGTVLAILALGTAFFACHYLRWQVPRAILGACIPIVVGLTGPVVALGALTEGCMDLNSCMQHRRWFGVAWTIGAFSAAWFIMTFVSLVFLVAGVGAAGNLLR